MKFLQNHNTSLLTFFLCLLFTQPVFAFVFINGNDGPGLCLIAVIASLPLCYGVQLIPSRWAFAVVTLCLMMLCGTDMFLVLAEKNFPLCANIMAALTSPPAESKNFTENKGIDMLWTIPQMFWELFCLILRFMKEPPYKKMMRYTAVTFIAAVLVSFIHPVRNLTPYNLLNEGTEAIHEIYVRHRLIPEAEGQTFSASRPKVEGREIYVFGVGESECAFHWSLNGYKRETNPQLATFPNLISFSNYCSTSTLTLYSVPIMVTRATVDDFNRNYTEHSIVLPYKECGFKTFIISTGNLLSYDLYLSRGADAVFNIPNDTVAPHLIDSLSTIYPKTFFIVQFYQSHMYYENFAPRFNRWRPNHFSEPDCRRDDIFLNAYDNTILNSDEIMANIIRIIDKPDVRSTFLYASDHGDELDVTQIPRGMGLHPNPCEYHSAMFFWYNDTWGNTHPLQAKRIHALQHKPINGENLFYTLCDMADISIAKQYAKPEWSLFSPHFRFHKRRIILPNGITIIDAK